MAKTIHTSVRLTPRRHAYLRARALSNGQSVTAELGDIIEDRIKAFPILFIIRRCQTRALGEFYTVAVGEDIDDFYEGKSEDEAYVATLAEIKKLGLTLREVEIEQRTETAEPYEDQEDKAA
jgi:hypothetical protein